MNPHNPHFCLFRLSANIFLSCSAHQAVLHSIRDWHNQWLLVMMAICLRRESQETNDVFCSKMAVRYSELLSPTTGHTALRILRAVSGHAAAAMFLTVPALGLAQMCLQLHSHLFQGTWWKPSAQVGRLSSNDATDSPAFRWASPSLHLKVWVRTEIVSPAATNKCKRKKFGNRREGLEHLSQQGC